MRSVLMKKQLELAGERLISVVHASIVALKAARRAGLSLSEELAAFKRALRASIVEDTRFAGADPTTLAEGRRRP